MKVYADMPARRQRQIAADVGFVLWTLLWLWLATRLYDLVLMLGGPGAAMESAGSSFSQNMTGAGDAIDGLPVVGDAVRSPFDRMSEAGQSLADAGRGQQEVVGKLAALSAFCVAAVPIATLAVIWLPIRIRFIRRAAAAQRLLTSAPDLDLFALRALARRPISELVSIDPDPLAAWRSGDPAVIRSLASLELRDEGLHVP